MELNGAVPIVPYVDPRAAISWLEKAFDATPTLVVPPEPDQPLAHAEVAVGTGVVMIDDAERTDSPFALPGPVVLYVVVDDPDLLHARAEAAGAEIIMPLTDQDYGSREFAARDPHGNVWSFGTYRPSSAG
ncbi:VOC family protein [Mycolicibacterium tokaiense]|uniref:Glyoxalase/bleomycin resistance protein/dioxygenase n=1 Tax=Mycolicibacterium tokaiense TaxID=39695 RepID=A0A378TPF7_9MYCO|nr:VOC family protein [Mycolicibacterium tokaiense]STZ62067.1 glyoxalase/bleomycin resistance protein/dioxygenase [Mycolicibacterium tokaiense]